MSTYSEPVKDDAPYGLPALRQSSAEIAPGLSIQMITLPKWRKACRH
jgi:hypothetical protein